MKKHDFQYPVTNGLVGYFYRTKEELIDIPRNLHHNHNPIEAYAYRVGEFLGTLNNVTLFAPNFIASTLQVIVIADIASRIVSIADSYPVQQQYQMPLEGLLGRGRRAVNRLRNKD